MKERDHSLAERAAFQKDSIAQKVVKGFDAQIKGSTQDDGRHGGLALGALNKKLKQKKVSGEVKASPRR